jgi:H+/Cl- antiporter ClcA
MMLAAVIVAGLTSLGIMGDYTYFGTTSVHLHRLEGWAAVPVCGVCCGLVGGIFSRILIEFGRGLPGRVGRLVHRYPIAFALLCGLGAALCGIASGNTVYGTGYGQVRALIEHGVPLPHSFGVLKFIATTLASISGVPGGIFSPSLAVGAGLGFDFAVLFPGVPLNALILLGMVSYFAGVVQAPITAAVIVTEMTNDHAMIIPLMTAAAIAYLASRLICAEGVYHALSKNFLPTPAAR